MILFFLFQIVLSKRDPLSMGLDKSDCDEIKTSFLGELSIKKNKIYCFENSNYGLLIFGKNLTIEGNYIKYDSGNKEKLINFKKIYNAFGILFGKYTGITKLVSKVSQNIHVAQLVPYESESKSDFYSTEIIINYDVKESIALFRNQSFSKGRSVNIYNPKRFDLSITATRQNLGIVDTYPGAISNPVMIGTKAHNDKTSANIQLVPPQVSQGEEISTNVEISITNAVIDDRLPPMDIIIEGSPEIFTLDKDQKWSEYDSVTILIIVISSVVLVLIIVSIVIIVIYRKKKANTTTVEENDDSNQVRKELNSL